MKVRRSAHIVVTWNDPAGDGEALAYSPLTGDRTALSRAELAELLTIPVDRFAARGDEWARSLCRCGVLLSYSSDARQRGSGERTYRCCDCHVSDLSAHQSP